MYIIVVLTSLCPIPRNAGLDTSDIATAFQQVSGEGMPERMARGTLDKVRLGDGFLHGQLRNPIVEGEECRCPTNRVGGKQSTGCPCGREPSVISKGG